ncbi:uncharacterized protein [Narcine bancroftii]|uniref:uncharacterized protein n=1 Tax=Narcine bancroftii TaxID=1343680 RepID=UPI0038318035
MNDADETVSGLKEGDTYKNDVSEEPTNDVGKEITNEDSRNVQHQEKVLGENLESKIQIQFVCGQDEIKTISGQDKVHANGNEPHEGESDTDKAQTKVNNDVSDNMFHVQKNTSVEDTVGSNVDEIQPQSNSGEGDVVKSETGQIQVQGSDDEQGETCCKTDKVQEQINLLGQSEVLSILCIAEGRSISGEHNEVLNKLDEAEDRLLSSQNVEALNEMGPVKDRSFICGQDEAHSNLHQVGDKPTRIQNNTQCDLSQFEVCPTSGQDEAQCERKVQDQANRWGQSEVQCESDQDQVNGDEKDDTSEGQLVVQYDSKIKTEGFMCKVKSQPTSGRDGVLIVKRFPTLKKGKRKIAIKSSNILAEAPGQAKAKNTPSKFQNKSNENVKSNAPVPEKIELKDKNNLSAEMVNDTNDTQSSAIVIASVDDKDQFPPNQQVTESSVGSWLSANSRTLAHKNFKSGMTFWCDICEVICNSAMNLQMHFLGSKHKKNEAAIKQNFNKAEGTSKDECFDPMKSRTMEDDLSTMKINKAKLAGNRFSSIGSNILENYIKKSNFQEAIIGLDFLTEFHYEGKMEPLYFCKLCHCKLRLHCTLTHIFGLKHRTNYLKKRHSHLLTMYGRNWKEIVRKKIAAIEKIDGRGTVKVVRNHDEPWICKRITPTKDGSHLPEMECKSFDQDQSTNMETSDSSDQKLTVSTSSKSSSRETSSRAGSWSDLKYPHCKSLSKCDKTRKRQSSQDIRHSGEEWRDEWNQYIKRSKSIKEDNAERENAMNSDWRLESKWNSPESRIYQADDYKGHDDSSRAREKKPGNIIKKEILGLLANFKIINDTDAKYVERIMYKLSNQLLQFGQRAMQLTGSAEQFIEETKKNSRADDHSRYESQWVGILENCSAQPTKQNAGASISSMQNNYLTPSLLNSIRRMDVKTMTSTLTRLAANNPAFEGIRISTLVTVLKEAGVLGKSSN